MLRLLLPKSLILCKMGPLWKSKIRSLEIPSGSFLEFRFKISFSRNFSASLVTRLGGFRSLMFASPYVKSALLDFTSGSLLLHFVSKVLTHFFYFGVRSHWRISQTDVCSMLRKIRKKSPRKKNLG